MEKSIIDKYELVVGLEVHVQLATESKIFASDANRYGDEPNSNIGVITLAHPGTLPKVNEKAFEYAIKMGIACNCEISRYNVFDRKNYFYPDLPKGYQLTQDKTPICIGGKVNLGISGKNRTIQLNRIHLEEDAGKSIHPEGENHSLVDLNRAGVPLIEVVTEPCIHESEDAFMYLNQLRRLVRYLKISDGNMEEGSLRCDANISVRHKGSNDLGDKVEVKNMNSARNVQRAIEHEFIRQIEMLENGEQIISETRTFNATTGATSGMRLKETLNDYRYFPDPDLPPVIVSEEMLKGIQESMPSLPEELFKKFRDEYKLPEYDVKIIIDTKEIASYYIELCNSTKNFKSAANWLNGPVKSYLNDKNINIEGFPLKPQKIAQIIQLIDDSKVSYSAASQKLFGELINNPQIEVENLAKKLDIIQESNGDAIDVLVAQVLDKYPDKVKDYKHNGKKNLIGMFMGEVMKLGKGKLDPKKANQALRDALSK